MKKNKTVNNTTTTPHKKHSKKKFVALALLAGALAWPVYLIEKA